MKLNKKITNTGNYIFTKTESTPTGYGKPWDFSFDIVRKSDQQSMSVGGSIAEIRAGLTKLNEMNPTEFLVNDVYEAFGYGEVDKLMMNSFIACNGLVTNDVRFKTRDQRMTFVYEKVVAAGETPIMMFYMEDRAVEKIVEFVATESDIVYDLSNRYDSDEVSNIMQRLGDNEEYKTLFYSIKNR